MDSENLRVLTVNQGWADLILPREGRSQVKDVENRTWTTAYRGDLLIHAGSGHKKMAESKQFCDLHGIPFPNESDLIFGAVIGIVELVGIERSRDSIWAQADNYHWILENPRRLDRPIACSGALRLWIPSQKIMDGLKIGAAGSVLNRRSGPGGADRSLRPQAEMVYPVTDTQLSFLW